MGSENQSGTHAKTQGQSLVGGRRDNEQEQAPSIVAALRWGRLGLQGTHEAHTSNWLLP